MTIASNTLNRLQRYIGRLELLQETLTKETNDFNKLRALKEDIDAVHVALLGIAETEQLRTLKFIEDLVTDGVTSVFDQDIKVILTQSVKAGNQTLDITITQDGSEERDPLSACGGGLVVVISIILRLCFVHLMRNKYRPVLVLDEPLAALSDEYVPKIAEYVSKIIEELNVQVILVTHHRAFIDHSDTAYFAQYSPEGSIFEKVK